MESVQQLGESEHNVFLKEIKEKITAHLKTLSQEDIHIKLIRYNNTLHTPAQLQIYTTHQDKPSSHTFDIPNYVTEEEIMYFLEHECTTFLHGKSFHSSHYTAKNLLHILLFAKPLPSINYTLTSAKQHKIVEQTKSGLIAE